MFRVRKAIRILILMALPVPLVSFAQMALSTISAFPLDTNPLVIRRAAQVNKPFSVTGERGAILGQQDGTFELWLLPVKMLHNARLSARLKDYEAVIDLNAHAANIEVRPDHTTITYSHAAITVKQHMFIPHDAEQGVASAVVLFEVHASRPAELTLSFDPAMELEWPAPNFGRPNGSWIPAGTGGAYALETDNPSFFGMVAMPNARHGLMRPYQERPLTTPLEFHFSYDPQRDDNSFYPLLCAVSDRKSFGSAARNELLARLLADAGRVSERYRATADYYAHFFAERLTVSTPDRTFDDAMRWAELAIDKAKVPAGSGIGLAGGWFTSGDSARPGFGWFFGRDTLWTLYAINSYGDFKLSRQALDFLLAHQRADGKMMHEYSQTAAEVDWEHLPYLYASADATPLFVMQIEDYVGASGDLAYLRQHWDNVQRAYRFTRSHTTNDVYDNTQGTGWVEEWAKLPHQEIYLAALDQQSSESYARLAALMSDEGAVREASNTTTTITAKLADYRGTDGMYRFSRNADGSFEDVPSVFPAVAWWNGHLSLPRADDTFAAWAGHGFSTDWGIRSVPAEAAIYDPISYHHGSVWPLYAGWISMAEYRTGRPLQAFAHLRNTAALTSLQDPGAVTEVLSGDFFQPLGRSSSHQLWSSAMILTPAIRGLFGLESDALNHTLHVAPQLPASWDKASVEHLKVGSVDYTVHFQREGGSLITHVTSTDAAVLCLEGSAFFEHSPCRATATLDHVLRTPLSPIEVEPMAEPTLEGERTSALKVLSENRTANELVLRVEAPSGTMHRLVVRINGPAAHSLKVEGASLQAEELVVQFSPAAGAAYQEKTITLRW
jgi:hypothetical protein